MRKCPACENVELNPVLTKQGVEVDICPHCEGVWLDKGEIYHFTKLPSFVTAKFEEAFNKKKPTSRKSPITGEEMVELPMFDGTVDIDFDIKTGGIWLDKGEINKFPIDKCKIDVDKGFLPKENTAQKEYLQGLPPELIPLPNLAISSGSVLFGMYAILTFMLILVVQFTGITPGLALLFGVGFALFQFLLGPFFMDLTLRFLYKINWVNPGGLPAHLKNFIQQVSADQKIKFPRMGIILDGSPQAFTYGHHPNNARIVISRGLLELLDEKEVEAVVAHEIGHVVHWDMLVMTIAQLVPLILYYIYRTLIRMRSRGKDNSAAARYAIAIGAYILYIISEYIVLWFSRIREYYADRFSGNITKNPSNLASALVKIGYGLAGEKSEKTKDNKDRSTALAGLEPLGIFNAKQANMIALTGYSSAKKMGGEINKQTLKDVAKWDLWNPWALYYELHSTHPLIAKRIKMLSNQSMSQGSEPYVTFDERKPESYWDDFLLDLFIQAMPGLIFLGGIFFMLGKCLASTLKSQGTICPANIFSGFGPIIAIAGVAYLLKVIYSYPANRFAPMNVKSLLKKVKVSQVTPVPCTIKGTIIGRGVPGLIFSEDFVLQDDTGIMFLDYRQPLAIFNFLFGLLRAAKYQNQEAEVTGWYRRAPVPYIELKEIKVNGKKSNCYVYQTKIFGAIALIVIGIFLFFI